MAIQVFNTNGEKVGEEKIPEIFSSNKINEHLIWEVVNAELANLRQGTHKTKEKGEVRGGGRKPWRQKGTGRARAGSNRSPIWKGGGTIFGPRPRDYRQNISRKKKRVGIQNILMQKFKNDKIAVVDSWVVDEISTSACYASFSKIIESSSFSEAYKLNRKLRDNTNDKRRKITLVTAEDNVKQKKSIKNIPWIQLIHCDRMAALPLHYNHGIIFTKEAFSKLEDKIKI